MAMSTVEKFYQDNEQSSCSCDTSSADNTAQSALTNCPPSSFPKNFQDFLVTLSEDTDDLCNMLEDKLIPRKMKNNMDEKNSYKRWTKRRTFQRRHSEIEVRLHKTSSTNDGRTELRTVEANAKPPAVQRQRSSSIAVPRPTPDLHKFLQTEANFRGHLSPSFINTTKLVNNSTSGATSSTLQLLNPILASPENLEKFSITQRTDKRKRTSSMPTVSRHQPMLGDTRRNFNPNAEEGDLNEGIEYYRLRSFSITANGVYNLGDSLKSRRSRSINSVTSSGTSFSSISQHSCLGNEEAENTGKVATYKVGMLGATGVGKTALTAQFTTSEYICAYDTSLDDEYGQKNVSVMIDGQETELEIIDHPASEICAETFCSTYNPDIYVIVYSVVDQQSFEVAKETLVYLLKHNYTATHGVILVGNKVDLERNREITSDIGRRLANSCGCKFIETSSGLAHHVDELLVGILAQIQLNPQRKKNQAVKFPVSTRHKHRCRILKHLLGFKRKTKSCENLFTL
ncbi:uncharacterized protein [Chelonus insularis]|uniref:uncharacterized protein n=1 Tax=Chelonus insularis TaxID=460826 RepID=UPI0015899539|nr:uncharacterized protein LOC118071827 [Chelonus insularis]